MQIDPATHLLAGTEYIPSPNMDERPGNAEVDLLVIHSISLPPGEYGGRWIEQLFSNTLPADAHPYFEEIHNHQVSAHALIKRDGSIVQFVPFNKRAWHAGDSCYQGKEKCNDFSIGIELEGTDTDTFEDAQYNALAKVINALSEQYPEISADHVTGHSDIAPGRKTDPGSGFDWNKLKTLLT